MLIWLSSPLTGIVEKMAGPNAPRHNEAPSEETRESPRRAMEWVDGPDGEAVILAGYRGLAEGAVFTSIGAFASGTDILDQHKTQG